MVGFDRVVGVLLGDVARSGCQLIERTGVDRWAVGGHFARVWAVLQKAGEEPVGGRQVPLLGDQHVVDLTVLVDGVVEIHPASGDLDVCFIDVPPIACSVPAGSGRIDQQRDEPLYPAIDADMVDRDAAFSQQLFDVAVREAIAGYQRTATMTTSGGTGTRRNRTWARLHKRNEDASAQLAQSRHTRTQQTPLSP